MSWLYHMYIMLKSEYPKPDTLNFFICDTGLSQGPRLTLAANKFCCGEMGYLVNCMWLTFSQREIMKVDAK